MDRSHYQVLGVRPTASTPEIRRAYRQLAYLLHPDRQSDATDAGRRLAERRMREVNVAWTTLSDPVRRSDYDRALARASGSGSPGRTASGAGSSAGSAPGSGASADPGRSGDWWDSDDPDAALARVKAAQVDPDEPDMSGTQFWLLRRGPIVVMVLFGLIIFVLTAYAGHGSSDPTATSAPPAIVAESDCVRVMANNMAYTVSCDSNYDARIVRDEPDVQACIDEDLGYAVVGAKSVCVKDR